MPAQREPTSLAALLAERIRKRGPMTFAEYMDACLYDAEFGYYSKADQQARRDYFTSVDAGPLFGRLLAREFHDMWSQVGCANPFWLVEAGAGTGTLARNVLDSAAELFPEFYRVLRYVAVERSDSRRGIQTGCVESQIARARFASVPGLPDNIPVGCIFSNELLDALPVHRVVRERDELREIWVGFEDGVGFHQVLRPPSSSRITDYFADQAIELREGQQAEVCLAACDWIEDAGKRLGRGFVLTIDYGHEARELYDERHMRGTLLAYYRHRADEDYFRAPGEQDLTAHVNFSALDLWGKHGGLVRSGLTSQTNFLLSLARHSGYADLDSATSSEEERIRRRLLFKTLIHPEGMGETFQVFVQHKGIDSPHLIGLDPLRLRGVCGAAQTTDRDCVS